MRRNNNNKTESELIRQKWRLQQERMKLHEKRKEILIKQYEIQQKHRLKQLTGGMHKRPEGTQISPTELRKIKVDIYRNIPSKSTASELQRDIVNPEDVMVKRRAGEGSKPIFEREELKGAVSNTEEVEERRTVAIVEDANLEKPQTSKRRSASLSLTRNQSYSHRRTSSSHSRYEDKHNDRESRRSKGDRSRTRERKEDRKRTQSCHVRDEKRSNERSRRNPSRSRERDRTKLDRNSLHSKSIRGRSGERRMPLQQIPIPIYYGNFPPSPIMVGPLVPIRGPNVAFGGSRYPMWPMRPFGPRFPPRIDMFRLLPSGNPSKFGTTLSLHL